MQRSGGEGERDRIRDWGEETMVFASWGGSKVGRSLTTPLQEGKVPGEASGH